MARTAITPKVLANQQLSVTAEAADFTLTACDATNFNDVPCTGKELLVFQNSGASPYTVTIYAAPDEFGRTGTVAAYSLAAGDFAVFGPFPVDVYAQTNGRLNFDASNVSVKVACLRTP